MLKTEANRIGDNDHDALAIAIPRPLEAALLREATKRRKWTGETPEQRAGEMLALIACERLGLDYATLLPSWETAPQN